MGPAPTEAAWRERLPGWQQERVELASAEDVPALLERHLVPLADRHAFAVDDASGVVRIFSRPRQDELDLLQEERRAALERLVLECRDQARIAGCGPGSGTWEL